MMSTVNRLLRPSPSVVNNTVKVTIGPRENLEGHRIQLNRTGDRIESIEVTCRCGETILVRCEYE
jgi:hypothetical protein